MCVCAFVFVCTRARVGLCMCVRGLCMCMDVLLHMCFACVLFFAAEQEGGSVLRALGRLLFQEGRRLARDNIFLFFFVLGRELPMCWLRLLCKTLVVTAVIFRFWNESSCLFLVSVG